MSLRFHHASALPKTFLLLILSGFAVLNGVIVWQLRDSIAQGYGDFAAFYTAGKIVERGEGRRLYDRELQWRIQEEFAAQVAIRQSPLPYIRPAFEALLFLPFAYFSYPVAYALWTVVKIGVLFAISWLLRLPSEGLFRSMASTMILCLSFFPVAFDLLQGQDAIVLLLLFVLAFHGLERGNESAAGIFLGLGLFKYHLVIPFLCVFLLRKKTKLITAFLSTAVALTGLSIAVVGWKGMLAYPEYLWSLNQTPGLLGIKSRSMPNVRGLISPLIGRGTLPVAVNWFLLAVVLTGIVMAAKVWRGEGQDSRSLAAGFSFCAVITIVTSYYANSYDLTLLLLPILTLGPTFVAGSGIRGWPRAAFLISAGVLLFSPLFWVVILRFDQFYWIAFVLLLLAISLSQSLSVWRQGGGSRLRDVTVAMASLP
jgi:Glycosyltransferase family 87